MPLLYEIIVLELRHRARQNVAPAGHNFAAFVLYNSRMKNQMRIMYKNKPIYLPFKDAQYNLDGDKEVEVANRFSGETVKLPSFAVAVYDVIIGAEQFKQYDTQRKGLDWFMKYFPKEYMVLLD